MKRVSHNNFKLSLALLMLCISFLASAQQREEMIDSCFQVYYPLSRTHIQEDYLDNAERIAALRHFLQQAPQIDSLVIYAYSSPEGSYAFNERLSRQRGERAKQYLRSLLPKGYSLPDSLIILSPQSENWDGLRREVVNNYPHDDKEALLAILDSDLSPTEKEVRLKQVSNGEAWRYLLKHYMPRLRYATWSARLTTARQLPPLQMPRFSFTSPSSSQPDVYVAMYQGGEPKLFPLAFKTNLLYDAVTALNVEVEVPIGKQWSVAVENLFPWWNKGNKYCFQLWEMGAEGRYWFRRTYDRKYLTGAFAGAYLMSGIYDLQNDRKFNYQGEFWSAGVTVGYAYKISRLFNLELSAAIGYLNTHYQHYYPTADYDILVRNKYKFGKYNYVGPTKLKVALVMPIEWNFQKRGGDR